MANDMTRRDFLGAAGTAVALGVAAQSALGPAPAVAAPAAGLRIVGVSCSPRPGMTTATALRAALEAAKAVSPDIEVELIDLGGQRMDAPAAGQPDAFAPVAAKLTDPRVGGILIGTPVYFMNMSGLCKTFLDRWIAFRQNNFALANKVGGVVAVGGVRNGGQETTIQSVIAALLSQEMVIVGDGRPTAHIGATVWNDGKSEVTQDEFGMSTARNLGRRVAEVALRLQGAPK